MGKSIFENIGDQFLRLVAGNTENVFVSNDLVIRDFDHYLCDYLKKLGYKRVIFYGGQGHYGMYFCDKDSVDLTLNNSTHNNDDNDDYDEDFDDDFEDEEDDDKENESEVIWKYPNLTYSQFEQNLHTVINEEIKTAIVFSDLDTLFSDSGTTQDLFNFVNQDFSYDNQNIMIFVSKKRSLGDIYKDFNHRYDTFLDHFYVAKNNSYELKEQITFEVPSPDNDEIKRYLLRGKILGIKLKDGSHRYKKISYRNEDLDSIVEILRSHGVEKNKDKMTLSYFDTLFTNYLEKCSDDILDLTIDETRQITGYTGSLEEKPYDRLKNSKGWEPALKAVNQTLTEFKKYKKESSMHQEPVNSRFEIAGSEWGFRCPNFILLGNPGVGKSTIADLIGKIFKENGILRNGTVITANSADLIGEYVGETAPKTNNKINEAKGGVLIIDEAYELYADPKARHTGGDDEGLRKQTAVNIIVSRALEDDICIILAGYTNRTRRLYEMNPGFKDRFSEIVIDNYQPTLLQEIFMNTIHKKGYHLDENLDLTQFFVNLKDFEPKSSFSNARIVENIAGGVMVQADERQGEDKKDKDITREDFVKYERYFLEVGSQEIMDRLYKEIDEKYVGMNYLKGILEDIRIKKFMEREAAEKGIKFKPTGRHFLLIGRPGSGKSTAAKELARCLYEMGSLSLPVPIEKSVEESYEIGELTGAIEDANDNSQLLFIDEGNAFVNSSSGKQMINPILGPMEDIENYPDLHVVISLYPENVEAFYKLDKGLRRRFKEIRLPDYDENTLTIITENKIREYHSEVQDDLREYLKAYFIHKIRSGEAKDKNANLSIELFDKMNANRTKRRMYNEESSEGFILEDFPNEEVDNVKRIIRNMNDPEASMKEIYDSLDQYVGLNKIKAHLDEIKEIIELENERKKEGIDYQDITKDHILLIGNPGTGKSTVLNLLAKFYCEQGILMSEVPIDFDAKSALNYSEDGGNQFKKFINQANDSGRLLCIDEANAFVKMGNGLYLNEFVKCAQDKDRYPHLRVAMCIYPEYEEAFLALDEGLERRFEIIHLDDYTGEQIYQMVENIADKNRVTISEDVKEKAIAYLNGLYVNGQLKKKNASFAADFFRQLNIQRHKRESEPKYEIILDDFNKAKENINI